MAARTGNEGQEALRERVIEGGLCTGCGACVRLCPYLEHHRDATVVLHDCDRETGRCYRYCPRTPTDLASLYAAWFESSDLTSELGAVKGLFMTRAADPGVRARAQHGGTVSTLVALALEEQLIDTAVLAEAEDRHWARARAVGDAAAVPGLGGSRFAVSPAVSGFHAAAEGEVRRVGVVATPCQALALAKMRANPSAEDVVRVGKLGLVIGLFCGWALSGRDLRTLLRDRIGDREVQALDIPPSKHRCMEVRTDRDVTQLPIEEVQGCVRESCGYCLDLTCEFADLSVGSARSPEGWSVDRGWNQLLVRTERGRSLLDRARDRGVLEFKDVPAENLEKLKRAAWNKKRTALRNLQRKSGSEKDFLYLPADDPVVRAVLDS